MQEVVWQAVVGVNCPHELASGDPGKLCLCDHSVPV